MKPTRPTYDEYRALSAEERELIRLGDALAFVSGKLEPTVAKRGKLKEDENPRITRSQLVRALSDGAELDEASANRALDALSTFLAARLEPERDVTIAIFDALIEAKTVSAYGYQALFQKQMVIFEETLAEAQKQLKSFDAIKIDADKAKAQTELAKAAFEKALANMQALAESAKANVEAYEIVAARTGASLAQALRKVGRGPSRAGHVHKQQGQGG
jgi:hypothetical protein